MKRKSNAQTFIEEILSFLLTVVLLFAIFRYVIGVGHTLSWALAYLDGGIQSSLSRLGKQLERR